MWGFGGDFPSQNLFSKLWTPKKQQHWTPTTFFFGCPEGENTRTPSENWIISTGTCPLLSVLFRFVFSIFFCVFFCVVFSVKMTGLTLKTPSRKMVSTNSSKRFRRQKGWNYRDLGKEISSLQENGQIEKWQAGLIFFGTFTISNIFCKIKLWSLLPEDADTSW